MTAVLSIFVILVYHVALMIRKSVFAIPAKKFATPPQKNALVFLQTQEMLNLPACSFHVEPVTLCGNERRRMGR